jgi:hypothetical protein
VPPVLAASLSQPTWRPRHWVLHRSDVAGCVAPLPSAPHMHL